MADSILINRIRTDNQGQVRAGLHQPAVEAYAHRYREGLTMDPVELVATGDGQLIIANGHHRVAAARLAGLTAIPAIVVNPPAVLPPDVAARIRGVAENSKTQVGFTREESKRALQGLLQRHPIGLLSNKDAAQLLGIGGRTAERWRAELGIKSPGQTPPHIARELFPDRAAPAKPAPAEAEKPKTSAPTRRDPRQTAFHLVYQWTRHPKINADQAVGITALFRELADTMPVERRAQLLELLFPTGGAADVDPEAIPS